MGTGQLEVGFTIRLQGLFGDLGSIGGLGFRSTTLKPLSFTSIMGVGPQRLQGCVALLDGGGGRHILCLSRDGTLWTFTRFILNYFFLSYHVGSSFGVLSYGDYSRL